MSRFFFNRLFFSKKEDSKIDGKITAKNNNPFLLTLLPYLLKHFKSKFFQKQKRRHNGYQKRIPKICKKRSGNK